MGSEFEGPGGTPPPRVQKSTPRELYTLARKPCLKFDLILGESLPSFEETGPWTLGLQAPLVARNESVEYFTVIFGR